MVPLNYAGKFDAKLHTDDGSISHVETVSSAHAPSDAIIVPDANLLFNGDFKRSGVDLILSKDDHELVLQDYFKGEKRAALSSPDGAHLTGDIVNALTGHVQYSQADGNASVGQMIGHVTKLVGNATAIRNGVSIILNVGDNVEKGDVVQSGSDSTLGVTFIDGTVFGLSSNARMVLNEMVYDPNGSNNSSLISLVAGTISFVAGETAKHGDMKIDTPVATMGIRGTAVLVEIDFDIFAPGQTPGAPGVTPTAKFQVLVEPDGTAGSYILFDKTTLAPIATVNQPGTATVISNGNVNFLTSAPLSADQQKLITDVFTQKFTDNTNPNTKSADNHSGSSVTPQPDQLIKLADGTTAVVTTVTVNAADKSSSQTSIGTGRQIDHIDGPPAIAVVDLGGKVATPVSFAVTELVGKTGDAADVDTVSGKVNFVDINLGDRPTVTAAFNSFTYQNAANKDVTATLSAQQLADIKAVEAKLAVVPDSGNTNNGSATWTYSVPDKAFDFLAAGETLTLKYIARVDNNFALNDEASTKEFTITIAGTNDVPVITTSAPPLTFTGDQQANGFLVSATDPATGQPVPTSGTLVFKDPDLTDTHSVSVKLTVPSGSNIPPGPLAVFEAALTASIGTDSTGTGSGIINWNLAPLPDFVADFLPKDQSITLTYTITVTDSQGATATQEVTITLGHAAPPDVAWINPTGGLWTTASNWETGTVPTAVDDVVIPDEQVINGTGHYAVTIDTGTDAFAHSVTLDAENTTGAQLILNKSSTLTIGGALTLLVDGELDNSGSVSVGGQIELLNKSSLQNSGLLSLGKGGDFKDQSTVSNTVTGTIEVVGGTLNDLVGIANAGLITIDPNATLTLNSAAIAGGTVTNKSSGIIDLIGNAVLKNGSLGNYGQISVSGSGNALDNENVTTNNSLEVLAGGALLLDLGTTIANAGGTITVDGTAKLTLNDATISGGTINDFSPAVGTGGVIAGDIDVTGSSTINGGAVLNQGDVTAESGVTLTLDNVTVNGTAFTETNASDTVSGSIIQIDGASTLTLNGASVTGGHLMFGSSSDALDVESAGATLDGVGVSGGGSIDVGTTTTGVILTLDDGTSITNGKLVFGDASDTVAVTSGGATLDGVNVSGGGSIEVGTTTTGVILTLDDGTTIKGGALTNSGTVEIESSLGATLDGVSVGNKSGTIQIDIAELPTTVTLLVEDGTTITGGKLSIGSVGVLDVEAGTAILAGAPDATLDGVMVANSGSIHVGTAIIASDPTLLLDDGTTITGGKLSIGSLGVFDVEAGTGTLAGAPDAALDGVAVVNHGNIDVGTVIITNDPTLRLDDGTTITGGKLSIGSVGVFDVEAGAGILAGAPDATLDGVTVVNHGNIDVGTAIITNDPTLRLDDGTSITGGTLSIASGDTLDIEPGAINGNGATLANVTVSSIDLTSTITVGHDSTLTLSGATISGGTINDFSPPPVGTTGSIIAGDIDITGSSTINGGAVLNQGDVKIESSVTLTLDNVTVTGTTIDDTAGGASVQIDPGKTLTLNGVTIDGGTLNDGTIDVIGSSTIKGDVTGTGTAIIDGNATLTLGGTDAQTVTFADNAGTIKVTPSFTGHVAGFAAGSAIVVTGFLATTVTYDGLDGKLIVSDASHTATINLTGNYSNSTFLFSSDGHGGTEIFNSPTVSAVQDHSFAFSIADFAFQDSDEAPPDTLANVIITSLPANGTLTDGTHVVTAADLTGGGFVVSAADIAAGKLMFTPNTDAHSDAFQFAVQDSTGHDTSGPATLTINFASDGQPTTSNSTVSGTQDTAFTFQTADFPFSDTGDATPDTLANVIISSAPNGVLTLNGTTVDLTGGPVTVSTADIAAGKLVLTPATDLHTASLQFAVQDSTGHDTSGPATLTINFASDGQPTTSNSTVSGTQDTAFTFQTADFPFSDTGDATPDTLANVIISSAPNGVLTLNGTTVDLTGGPVTVSAADIAAGKLVFTPATDLHTASLQFAVQDSTGHDTSGPATLTINFASDGQPTTSNSTVSGIQDTAFTFQTADFPFSDTGDAPPDTLANVIISSAPNGVLTLNGTTVDLTGGPVTVSAADIAAGKLVFTPATDLHTASLQFAVQDSTGHDTSGPATLTINFASDGQPTTSNSTVSGTQDTAFTFQTADFPFSDTGDATPDTLANVIISSAPNGVLTLNGTTVDLTGGPVTVSTADIAAGKLVLTPATDLHTASLQFAVQDSTGHDTSGPATLTINFASDGQPTTSNSTVSGTQDTAFTFQTADFPFSDTGDATPDTLANVIISSAPNGVLTLNGTTVDLTGGPVTVSAADIAAGKLVFTPTTDLHTASLQFAVQDSTGHDTSGPATLTINFASDGQPTTSNSTVSGIQDTAFTFQTADFPFSDTGDAPPDTLANVIISSAPNGVLTLNGTTVDLTGGPVTVSAADIAAGKLVFTPATDLHTASLQFAVQDSTGHDTSGPATLTINFASDGQPTTSNSTVSGTQDTAFTFQTADFPFSDTGDATPDTLANVIISSAPNGVLTLNGTTVDLTGGPVTVSAADIAAGKLVFTPTTDLHTASLQFAVQDSTGHDTSSPATLTINFASDGQPTTSNSTVSGTQDTAFTFQTADFPFSDTGDATPDTLANVIISSAPNGVLTLNGTTVDLTGGPVTVSAADIAAGKLVFTPATDLHTASLQFAVQDSTGHDTSSPATLTINFASDGQPTTSNSTVSGTQDTAFTFQTADFPFSDTGDATPDTLANVIISSAPNGVLTLNGTTVDLTGGPVTVSAADIAAGKLVFTPATDLHTASLQFAVQDSTGHDTSSPATLTINFASDGQPTTSNSTVSGTQDTAFTFQTADFPFSDTDAAADTLANVIITSLPANGTLTDGTHVVTAADLTSGGFVVSAADIVAGKLVFTPNAGASSDSFQFEVQDGAGQDISSAATLTINLASTGQPTGLVVHAPAAETIIVNQPSAISDVSLTEVGSTAGETFTVVLSDTHGQLSANIVGDGDMLGFTNSGTTLTITGSLSDVNADLKTLTDTNNTAGSDPITVSATDSLGNGPTSQTIDVTAQRALVFHAPEVETIGVNQPTKIQAADGSPVSLSDVGNAVGKTFTVTVSDLTSQLSAQQLGSSTVSVGNAGAFGTTLTIQGSLIDVNKDLATLTDTDGFTGSDLITLDANDGSGNSATQQSILVQVNGVPSIIAPFSQTIGVGQTATISGASVSEGGITDGETFTVVLSDTNGQLSATTVGDGDTVGVTNSGTTLTITGSLSDVNTDLKTLTDTNGTAGSDPITVSASDSLNNSATSQTIDVTVQAPVVTPSEPFHWINASGGDFALAANWDSNQVPSTGDDAAIGVPGTYTVTSAIDETVNSLTTISTATLDITGGTFTIENGTGTGSNAGLIEVDVSGTLALNGGTFTGGTITDNGLVESTASATLDGVGVSGAGSIDVGTTTTGVILTLDDGTGIASSKLIFGDSSDTVDVESGGATLDGVSVSGGGSIDVGTTTTGVILTLDDGTTVSGGKLTIGSAGVLDIEVGPQGQGGANGPGNPDATLDGVKLINSGTIDVDPAASGAILMLDDGTTITGGALHIGGKGEVYVQDNGASFGATLDGVAVTNDGSLEIGAPTAGSTLFLDGGTTISGGTLTLHQTGDAVDVETGGVNHSGPDATLDGVTVNNIGTIEVGLSTSGAILALDDGTTVTSVALRVAGGSTLTLNDATISNSTIDASPTGTGSVIAGVIDVTGSSTINLSTELNSAAVTVESRATLTLDAVTAFGDTFIDTASGAALQIDSRQALVLDGTTIEGGTINDNGGEIVVMEASTIDDGAVINNGQVMISGGVTLTLDNVTANGVTFAGVGTIANTGTIAVARGSTVDFLVAVTGTGSATIGESAILEFGSTGTQTVTFAGNSGILSLGQNSGFGGEIAGFSGSDILDLAGFNAATTSVTASFDSTNTTLSVADSVPNGSASSIILAGDHSGDHFVAFSDGNGGSFVVVNPVAPTILQNGMVVAGMAHPPQVGSAAFELQGVQVSGVGNGFNFNSADANSSDSVVVEIDGASSISVSGGNGINLTSAGASLTLFNAGSVAASGTGSIGISAVAQAASGNTTSGNVSVNDLSNTTVSGDTDGIKAIAANGTAGTGNVTVDVYANATIDATSSFGIFALNKDTGNITVTTSSGDSITAGSAGIDAVNEDTSVAASASSVIDVNAFGTIHSGSNDTGSGNPPAGILAGYEGGTTDPTAPNFPVPGVFGDVLVNNAANITADAGDGIRAFNFGIGSITVNDNAGTITALGGATPVNGFGNGIAAHNFGGGDISVTTAAGTSIHSGGSGISALDLGPAAPLASFVSVVANGTIISGSIHTGNGSVAAGILAGYDNNGSNAVDSNDHGNVTIDDFASITATGGTDGIRGFNFGDGTVTITAEADAVITAASGGALRFGIDAFGDDGGNVSVTNFGSVTGGTDAISAETTGTGTATIDNHGQLFGDVAGYNATFTNELNADWSLNGTSAFTGTGTSTLANLGTIDSNGTSEISGLSTFTNTGTIEVESGSLKIDTAVTGGGAAVIDGGTTMEFGAGVAAGQTVTFGGATGTLIFDTPSSFAGKIAGISGSGDVLDLKGFDAAHDTVVASTGTGSFDSATDTTSLLVTDETTSQSVTLKLAGDLSGSTWTVTGDGHGGANIVDPPASGSQALAAVVVHDPGPAPSQTIVASVPNETLTGHGNSDTFVFNFTNLGHDTVTDFHPATDVLQFGGSTHVSAQAALDATHDDGHGNAVVTLDAHDTITLAGVLKAQLHAADFHFV